MRKLIFGFIIVLLFQILPEKKSLAQAERRLGGISQQDETTAKDTKVVESKIRMWYLDSYGAFQDSTKLDTLQDYFHIFNPVYKKEKVLTATYLGNYATPAIDNNFFNRKYETPYFFAQSRDAYILSPSELKYVNTTTPYTRLDYSQSENKSRNNETRFNVIHSRNINPWWNFTFRVDLAKSDGQYVSQETRNNSVSLYSSYVKDNWKVHAGFITNSIRNNENGGLVSDSLLKAEQDAQYWNVNLVESQSRFSHNYFFANGEYRFGKYIETVEGTEDIFRPIMGFIVSSEVNFNRHEFSDEEADDNDFFRNTFYQNDYIADTIRFNRILNVFQLKQYENADKKYSFGKRALIGAEIERGTMPGEMVENSSQFYYPEHLFGQVPDSWQPDSIVLETDIRYSNAFLGGGIFRETGRFWKWNFDGKFYFSGRKAGQTELSGLIYKPFPFLGDSLASLSFDGALENLAPDYFQERFYSNHYRWNNNFDMEQRITLGATFKMPERKLEIGAKYAIINNFLYNDTLGIPDQTSNELLVLSAYLDKDFNYRRLHFRTRVLWQKVSDDKYLHLPEWSAFVSAYYQFTVSKVLFTQIGSDVRYNTEYYADAYAPSTGLFYLQNEKKYGNYPYIDVYASLRLKRTRVFFKYMNLGTHFLDGEYMTSPHYPMNRATFRLGLSWAFYD